MRKVLSLVLASVFLLFFGASIQSSSQTLPPSFPAEISPLITGIGIVVMENPASKGVEVFYASYDNIDFLLNLYMNTLKDAESIDSQKTSSGYWIYAKMAGVDYSIMLDEKAMNPNPEYAGMVAVHLIITGLEGIGEDSSLPMKDGKEWPTEEMTGVPKLEGYIERSFVDDGVIYLEIVVESESVVHEYITEITKAGFTLDETPSLDHNHIQFFAFKDASILNFAYDVEEGVVYLEYQK